MKITTKDYIFSFNIRRSAEKKRNDLRAKRVESQRVRNGLTVREKVNREVVDFYDNGDLRSFINSAWAVEEVWKAEPLDREELSIFLQEMQEKLILLVERVLR